MWGSLLCITRYWVVPGAVAMCGWRTVYTFVCAHHLTLACVHSSNGLLQAHIGTRATVSATFGNPGRGYSRWCLSILVPGWFEEARLQCSVCNAQLCQPKLHLVLASDCLAACWNIRTRVLTGCLCLSRMPVHQLMLQKTEHQLMSHEGQAKLKM